MFEVSWALALKNNSKIQTGAASRVRKIMVTSYGWIL
jgi:hypothetical protein